MEHNKAFTGWNEAQRSSSPFEKQGVCRAWHMFLKVRRMYLIFRHLASHRPSVSKIPPSGMEASWSETETRAKGERECSERQRRSGMATEYR